MVASGSLTLHQIPDQRWLRLYNSSLLILCDALLFCFLQDVTRVMASAECGYLGKGGLFLPEWMNF